MNVVGRLLALGCAFIFVGATSVHAETLSGSTYTLNGGVVYTADTLTGAQYSLSGSGEVVTGSGAGTQYSQTSGIYSQQQEETSNEEEAGSDRARRAGVRATVQGEPLAVDIQAYSYSKGELTFIVAVQRQQDAYALAFITEDKTVLAPSTITNIDSNIFLLRVAVPEGTYALALKNTSGANVGEYTSLFEVVVNGEGNGVTVRPETGEGIIGDSVTYGSTENLDQPAVEITSLEVAASTSGDEAGQGSDSASDTTCTVFGVSCWYFVGTTALLLVCVGYILKRKSTTAVTS